MKRDQWLKSQHKKNLKTFMEVYNKITKGIFLIASARIDKESVGSGYRFTVYLRPKDE